MDSRDKHPRKHFPLWKSFYYAICGLQTAIKEERNLRIHLVVTVVVVSCAAYFSISKIEWLFIILAIGGMLALEILNTAVERLVDLVTKEYHPLAKAAKDLAAAAVFLYAIMAVMIGIIIFYPHLFG